ncbi:MAG TPA: tetratricopeptide repeat protein [Candidatus Eisenbacteria bacterium]|jgi:tetratricopeptide (TPR) repeat protein
MALETQKSARLALPGSQELERLAALWQRYGRFVLGAAGALVVAGGVTFLNLRTRAASEEQASIQLAQASLLYWQGEYARSREMARQVATQYSSVPSGVEAHRLTGDNAYWSGDFKGAVAEYRRYLDKEKRGLLADAARRSLAYALESDHQYLEAARLYEQLVGVFDRGSSAEFLTAAARCYRLAGRPADAIQRLQRVDHEFGETSYAPAARIELAELSAAHP